MIQDNRESFYQFSNYPMLKKCFVSESQPVKKLVGWLVIYVHNLAHRIQYTLLITNISERKKRKE